MSVTSLAKEFEILQKHKNNETLGACLHLVDILMDKIEPGTLSVESEVKNMIIELQNAKLSSEAEFKEILILIYSNNNERKCDFLG